MTAKLKKHKGQKQALSTKGYRFWNLMIWKTWFDIGNGWTGYITKVLVIVGIGFAVDDIKNVFLIIILGIIYAGINFLIGWAYIKYGLLETQQEINNIYNPFEKQV